MKGLHEDHKREQYFFDDATAEKLAKAFARFGRICCLGCPTVARELHGMGRMARLLDVDERLAEIPGFRRWNLYRPEPLDEAFEAVLCDPPFWTVKLSQLFRAVRVLSRWDFRQRLAVSYLVRRSDALLATFARFCLGPTGERMGYLTVPDDPKNEVRLYANFDLATGKAAWE